MAAASLMATAGGGLAARRRRLVSQARSEAVLRQRTRQQRAVTQTTPSRAGVCQAGERLAKALPEAASAGQHRSRMRLEARAVRRLAVVAAVRAGRPQPLATRTPARPGTRHRPRRRPAARLGLATTYRTAAVPPRPVAMRRRQAAAWRWLRRSRQAALVDNRTLGSKESRTRHRRLRPREARWHKHNRLPSE